MAPGFTTVMAAVPADVMLLAGTEAVTTEADTNVVVRAAPFQVTAQPLTNPDPFTVSVNVGPPTVALEGLRLVIAGGGGPDDPCRPANPRQLPTPVTKSHPAVAL